MDHASALRKLGFALILAVCVLAAATVGFRYVLDEGWEDALYRAVVTSSLAGVDSRPSGTGGEVLTMLLVLAGVAIFGYVAAVLVESITHGVVTGAWAERRRQRGIDKLDDHYIICGYGRVGRRQDVAQKLRRAGANRVVQPYSTAGKEMATLVLKPQVAAFLDAASATGGQDLRFEEIELSSGSSSDGKSIKELHIRERTGALIIALRKADGTFDTTPNPEVVLEAGDVMITVGTQSELRALERLFAPAQTVAR